MQFAIHRVYHRVESLELEITDQQRTENKLPILMDICGNGYFHIPGTVLSGWKN